MKLTTSGGWFGYLDQPGLNPTPEAPMAVYAEFVVLAAAIALLVLVMAPLGARRSRAAVAAS